MYWLFKKELNEINQYYKEDIEYEIERVHQATKLEIAEMKKNYETPKRIFTLFPNCEILGIEINKNDEEVYIFKTLSSTSLYIYLCGPSYQAANDLPKIMSKFEEDYTEGPSSGGFKKNLYINSIEMGDNEIGNGSIAMKYFLKTVEKLKESMNIEYITGYLSPNDSDHFERLEGYYKKFDFEVTFDESRTSGSIKKILQ